jgi:hypothetical protein
MLLLLDSSNSVDKVGKALVSTWLRASVMQYSEVSGGKNDAESVVRSRGTLLIKNDRRIVVVCPRSVRDVAFARISKEARIRSVAVDWRSPCFHQHFSSLFVLKLLT